MLEFLEEFFIILFSFVPLLLNDSFKFYRVSQKVCHVCVAVVEEP